MIKCIDPVQRPIVSIGKTLGGEPQMLDSNPGLSCFKLDGWINGWIDEKWSDLLKLGTFMCWFWIKKSM